MASWKPTTPFEEEVVAQQPFHNFIFGDLNDQEIRRRQNEIGRPQFHLEKLENKKTRRNEEEQAAAGNLMPSAPVGHSLRVMRVVNEIAGLKNMGTDTTYEDWETRENAERETVAMIRFYGMGPSYDMPLKDKLTIPTLPVDTNLRVVRNGEKKIPVILDDEFFAVKTTRSRNAEMMKAAGINNKNETKYHEIAPLLIDEEKELETLNKVRELKVKQFQEHYPTLGAQKKIKSKKISTTANAINTSNTTKIANAENDMKNDFYTHLSYDHNLDPIIFSTTNTSSILDESFYLSCSSPNSSSDTIGSSFYTASECSDSSFSKSNSNSKELKLKQNYAQILQQTEKIKLNDTTNKRTTTKNTKKSKYKPMYTPNDVYYIKHPFNNDQRNLLK